MKAHKYTWWVVGVVLLLLFVLLLIQQRPARGEPPQKMVWSGVVNDTVNASSFSLTVTSPRRVSGIVLNATWEGADVSAKSWNGTKLVDVPIHRKAWEEYRTVAIFGNVSVAVHPARDRVVVDTANLADWLDSNVPADSSIADPYSLLEWESMRTPFMATNASTTLNYSFRGSHEFLLQAAGDFEATIVKTDMNWYPGPDNLSVLLSTVSGAIVLNETVPDDGLTQVTRATYAAGYTFRVSNLTEGTYRLRVIDASNGSDSSWDLSLNTDKVVVLNKVFALKPFSLNVRCAPQCALAAITYHAESVQNIRVGDEKLQLRERANASRLNVSGTLGIYVPKGDVTLSGFGRGAFTPDGYFSEFEYVRNDGGDILLRVPAVPITFEPGKGFTNKVTFTKRGDMLYMQDTEVLLWYE